jgi:hypothetical protein
MQGVDGLDTSPDKFELKMKGTDRDRGIATIVLKGTEDQIWELDDQLRGWRFGGLKICDDGITLDLILPQGTEIYNERNEYFILSCEFASCIKDIIVQLNTL